MNKVYVTTSWDDGHILDIKLADLLKKYNLAGTFYISPKDKEIPPESRLRDEKILELSQSFEIGGHTMTHPLVSKIEDKEAEKDILEGKKYLENLLGREVTSFCYPGGFYKESNKKILRDAGFKLARTVERFKTETGSDHFALPTTIQAYRHYSDVFGIFREVGIVDFLKCFLNWDVLAIKIFDNTLKNGGVFHIWGHSWEIENNSDWERLEKVFKHISNRNNVSYITNSEIVWN